MNATPSSERRAAEGGLAAALKSSRGSIDALQARRERMEERFRAHERECQHLRDLTCAHSGSRRRIRSAEESEREREACGLSERISACIERAGKAVAGVSEQQEDAELSLLRANAAILNRINTPKAPEGAGRGEKRCARPPRCVCAGAHAAPQSPHPHPHTAPPCPTHRRARGGGGWGGVGWGGGGSPPMVLRAEQ